jgi:DnaK suppressor protein
MTLDAAQLEDFRRRLETLRGELARVVEGSAVAVRPVSLDEPIGRLSRMDAMQQQEMARANRTAARARLSQVEAALARLDRGTYGACLDCDEDIAAARLAAQPEALLCIGCQREREEAG